MKRVFLTLLLMCCVLAYAQDVVFEANVDRNKAVIGSSVRLSLTFHNTQNVSAPQLPEISGMQSRYLGPSTALSIVNGKMSSSITHNYILVPLKTGNFTIGPLSATVSGKTYTSGVINVEVVEAEAHAGSSLQDSSYAEQKLETGDRLFAVMQVDKRTLFLNEEVPLKIKLYVNNLSVRDLEFPEITHEGVSVAEYDRPSRYQEAINGVNYDVVEFKTRISGIKQGEFNLGPARIRCNLLVKRQMNRRGLGSLDDFFDDDFFSGFFGAQQQVPQELATVAVPITVMPLPEENKPEGFTGAIGRFQINVEASPKEVKAGDPVTLRVRISGQGNFSTVNSFSLSDPDGFKVYEAQSSLKDNVKTFEQVLIPKSEKVVEVPRINFSFFDPGSGRYEVASGGPIPLKVSPPDKQEQGPIIDAVSVSGEKAQAKEVLGRDIVYIKDSLGKVKKKGEFLYKNFVFMVFNLFLLMLYFCLVFLNKRSERLKTDLRYARRMRASKKAKSGIARSRKLLEADKIREFYDSVFSALQEYIGDKFHLPKGGITFDAVDNFLREKGINSDILAKLKEVFRDCDVARYAPADLGKQDMEKALRQLEEIIDYLERKRV